MKSDHGKTPVNIRAFPRLDATEIGPTLNAVHAYTQVLGDWLGSSLPKRKHWWQLTVQGTAKLTQNSLKSGSAG